MTFQIVSFYKFIHDLCELGSLHKCRVQFMVFNLCDKTIVADINLWVIEFCQVLSLSRLFLQVNEGVKDDSEDKVHYEEVAYDHNDQAVNDCKGLIIHIHHVIHHGAPAVGRDKLIYHDQGTSDIVEGCNIIEDLAIVFHIVIINA